MINMHVNQLICTIGLQLIMHNNMHVHQLICTIQLIMHNNIHFMNTLRLLFWNRKSTSDSGISFEKERKKSNRRSDVTKREKERSHKTKKEKRKMGTIWSTRKAIEKRKMGAIVYWQESKWKTKNEIRRTSYFHFWFANEKWFGQYMHWPSTQSFCGIYPKQLGLGYNVHHV